LASTVTVQSGDTLSGIAADHHLSWPAVWAANRTTISNPNLIFPGQHLRLGGGGGGGGDREAVAHHAYATTGSTVAGGGVWDRVWDRIAQCESGGDWSTDTGNGFFGGLQFTRSSWQAAGGTGMPNQASRSEQIRVAINLQRMQGWGAWPTCSRKAGL